jgi:hypothetical protein
MCKVGLDHGRISRESLIPSRSFSFVRELAARHKLPAV